MKKMCSLRENKQLALLFSQVSQVAKYLWEKGWAERNGGNLSVNVTAECRTLTKELQGCRYVAITSLPKELASHSFFITGTGLRIRDLMRGIEGIAQNACIIYLTEDVQGYYILCGGEGKEDFRPTSELIPHLKIHLDLIKRNSPHRAVLHTHPTELIALSHSHEYNKSSAVLTNYLWSMLPEVRAFVPRGISLVPYLLPSSEALADATVEALRNYDVALWEKHGAVATGKDLFEAFDFIDVANKGATIFLQCLSAGFKPEGLSKQQLQELEVAFNL